MHTPRIVCYNLPINMRLSAESLATVVAEHGHQLISGDVFLFFNSKRDQCKVVWHDSKGYCSIDKRLSTGTFAPKEDIEISDSALRSLLSGGFFGSDKLMAALRDAARGQIIHISAARSGSHHR
jgi:transposase